MAFDTVSAPLTDFLEVSIRGKPRNDESRDEFAARAKHKQQKLEAAARDRGVTISDNPENKTRRVLNALTAGDR
ncbi:hypothetical protein [Streptomyces chartreusis]|uniref:hypothetical protein n=1 Tax=Streptomyces chartreusis TaxID=1969 RepID=UPI003652ADE7